MNHSARRVPFSHTSRHARSRIRQRCRLTEREIVALLDAKACVDTGQKPGCDRHRLLFWSAVDGAAFVAVRDARKGTVVTVLPLDHHTRLAWPVKPEDIDLAKRLAAQRDTGPARVKLNLHHLDDEGRLKTRCIWRGEAIADTRDVPHLLARRDVHAEWVKSLRDAGMHADRLVGLSLRPGDSGERVDLPDELLAALVARLCDHR